MFCRFCGSELPDNAIFCSNCGARIVSQHQAANQQQPGYQQQGYQQPGYQRGYQQPGNAGADTRPPKKKGGIGKFALTAVAGVAGVALATHVMGGFGNLPGGSGTSAAYFPWSQASSSRQMPEPPREGSYTMPQDTSPGSSPFCPTAPSLPNGRNPIPALMNTRL